VLTALVVTGCAWGLNMPLVPLVVMAVASTLAHLLGWAVGAAHLDSVKGSTENGDFYESGRASSDRLKRACSLGLLTKGETPPATTSRDAAQALAEHYMVTNLALRDWLFEPEAHGDQ
jgi:hypothetical protein